MNLYDLDLVIRCAKRTGVRIHLLRAGGYITTSRKRVTEVVLKSNPMTFYCPLVNQGQAMDLIERLHLTVTKTLRTPDDPRGLWIVMCTDKYVSEPHRDLKRAVCECVARMLK